MDPLIRNSRGRSVVEFRAVVVIHRQEVEIESRQMRLVDAARQIVSRSRKLRRISQEVAEFRMPGIRDALGRQAEPVSKQKCLQRPLISAPDVTQ